MTEMTDSTGKLYYAPKHLQMIILFIYECDYYCCMYMYMIINHGTELTY